MRKPRGLCQISKGDHIGRRPVTKTCILPRKYKADLGLYGKLAICTRHRNMLLKIHPKIVVDKIPRTVRLYPCH